MGQHSTADSTADLYRECDGLQKGSFLGTFFCHLNLILVDILEDVTRLLGEYAGVAYPLAILLLSKVFPLACRRLTQHTCQKRL